MGGSADPNAVNDRGQTPLGIAFAASSKDGPARAAFKSMHEILSGAGGALGAFNPTLYSNCGGRGNVAQRAAPTQPPTQPPTVPIAPSAIGVGARSRRDTSKGAG